MSAGWMDEGRTVARRLNRYVRMTVPTVLAVDESFELRITVFGPDGLPEETAATIEFDPVDGVAGLPLSVGISPADRGMLAIPRLRALDVRTIHIGGRMDGTAVVSNVAWVYRDPPYRLYWGDIHVHSRFSNCHAWACKSPGFAYTYARDAAHLDFASIADHTRGLALEADRWARLQAACREFHRPGRFVTLLAFENSHAQGYGGDNNVYYRGTDAGFFWIDREDMKGNDPKVPLEQMWKWLDTQGRPYMTAPHHTGRRDKYRTFADPVYDPVRERFFEIYSAWGSSEARWTGYPVSGGNNDGQGYFVDSLRQGCRYGVIASSDDHTTMPGGESRTWKVPLGVTPANGYHHKGLVAVRCNELTREAVWDALYARTSYATTFLRMPLEFSVGEVPMGQAVALSASDALRANRPVRLRWSTAAGGDVIVTVMRNGKEWRRHVRGRHDPHGPVEEAFFVDDEPLERIAIRGAVFHPGPFVAYYARVETAGGETAWTSPVWLDGE